MTGIKKEIVWKRQRKVKLKRKQKDIWRSIKEKIVTEVKEVGGEAWGKHCPDPGQKHELSRRMDFLEFHGILRNFFFTHICGSWSGLYGSRSLSTSRSTVPVRWGCRSVEKILFCCCFWSEDFRVVCTLATSRRSVLVWTSLTSIVFLIDRGYWRIEVYKPDVFPLANKEN